jgi:phosphatidylserine/phosphatidylglycerophosphate/cardiolipin synthase-like enzyme
VIDRIDAALGNGLERAIAGHHRRRLRRRGRVAALEPDGDGLWGRTGTPPREGNRVEVLIDGADALPAMAAAMRGAQRYVHICSWHMEPGFRPERDAGAPTMRELLGELAERIPVRVLQWAGAPLPVFAPRRGQVRAARAELRRGTLVRAELDACTRLMHCHHEKLVIVDGEVAFVGGIDFTSLAGDRFDSHAHPVQPDGGIGWHDAGTRLHGPIVRDVAAHFELRWEAATGEAVELPEVPARAGDTSAQLVRTVPETAYRALHDGEFSALEAYVRALRSAQRLIYLENQFLWSPELGEILEAKLRDPPCDEFRLLVVLPQKANNGQDDTKGLLGRLVAADGGAGRLLATTLHSRSGRSAGPLYVHAKVGIVDDRWLAVGSANLNEHSLFNDTEVDVVSCDGALARDTRLRLWSEHLERPREDVDGDPAQVIDDMWAPIAREQLERRRAGAPPTHRLIELEGVSRRSARLIGPLDALVVDG